MSLNFTITPPVYASQCVLNYTLLSSTNSDGNRQNITVQVTGGAGETLIYTEGGFDLCRSSYSFTIVANTFAGIGESSTSEVVDVPSKIITFSLSLFPFLPSSPLPLSLSLPSIGIPFFSSLSQDRPPGAVTITMDVNEQNLCADHEELTITATIYIIMSLHTAL